MAITIIARALSPIADLDAKRSERRLCVCLISHYNLVSVPDVPDQPGPECLEINRPPMLYARLCGVGGAVEHPVAIAVHNLGKLCLST